MRKEDIMPTDVKVFIVLREERQKVVK